jgi:hypothetical protein
MIEPPGFQGNKLLLMGSKAFKATTLPAEVTAKLDVAIQRRMVIIVGEAPGACRLYQDYLHSQGYRKVIVGHAKSLRYNAGNWTTRQYGEDLKDRERGMIDDCDSALVIWINNSGVIAENLERLKRRGKPTFLYETSTQTSITRADWISPDRIYDPYYHMQEHYRKRRRRTVSNKSGRSPDRRLARPKVK